MDWAWGDAWRMRIHDGVVRGVDIERMVRGVIGMGSLGTGASRCSWADVPV